MFLKGPHNEHRVFTSLQVTVPAPPLNVPRRIALVFALTLMYTCLHRAKSYALFQIIGAFQSAEVGLPSPTGHLPVIAFTATSRQTYCLLITLPSKSPPSR